MNGFLNLLSAAIQPLQAGYLGPFDSAFASSIGGYPAGAIVSGSTAGTFWVSTADQNTTTPGATDAAWQSLFNGLQPSLGFTPVQQGGGPGQTTDKINLGQDATYSGLLRIAIDGVDKGTLLSGTYLATITGTTGDLPGMGLWFQNATQRPAFTYQDATGAPKIIDLPNQADVQQVQTNLTAAIASQAATNATLSADISDCVSGVYGKGSGDYQIQGLYQQGSTGRPIVVYNNGSAYVFEGLATSVDITTLQSNLTSALASQATQNSTFSSEIAARVPTNAANDGVNAPITLFNYYLGTGVPWFVANGAYCNLVQTNPGSGWNQIKNISVENDNGALTVLDTTGKTTTYGGTGTIAASGNIVGGWWTRTGGILRQVFKISTAAADNIPVTFPLPFTEVPVVNATWADANNASAFCNIYVSDGTPEISETGVTLWARANTSGNTWVNSGGTGWIIAEGPG
ncbi:hypothetical protein [Komagataeibacter europaeus]|uniref:hypothetical protein n=1 Tax=Komagataeibacter europaeus TaxID=33995 RepID=UPI001E5293ED|nr:hypothetical protein [Komagataeibacter europaeus]